MQLGVVGSCLQQSKGISISLFLTMFTVATALGKQGIWMFIFPDRANTGSLTKSIKNFPPTQRKFEVLKIKHSFGGYGLMSL